MKASSLFSFIIILSSQGVADSINLEAIYQPDVIYDPDRKASAMADQLESSLGVIVPRAEADFPQVRRVIISTDDSDVSARIHPHRRSHSRQNPVAQTDAEMGGTSGTSDPSHTASPQGSSNINESHAPLSQRSINTSAVDFSQSGDKGSAVRVSNGLLYSDEPFKSKIDGDLNKDQLEQEISPPIPPAGQSQNSSEPLNTGVPTAGASQSQNGSGDRQITSRGLVDLGAESLVATGESEKSGNIFTNALTAIAKKLGLDSFFGTTSLGQNSSPPMQSKSKQSKLSQASHKETRPLKDPRSILKAQFERYNKRNLANSLEFGDSQSFLFTEMCKHYMTYAEKNQIPNDISNCPTP